jgi:hypothetical protein
MYRKLIVAGAAAAAIVGSGTAAMALTGSSTPSGSSPAGSSAASSSAAAPARSLERKLLRRTVHGQFVTRDKSGHYITHDYARGKVSGVSTQLIVVHTADGTSQRFAVTSATKVRLRSNGKGTAGKITDVHVGDTVLVGGVGSGTPSAGHVLDLGKR